MHIVRIQPLCKYVLNSDDIFDHLMNKDMQSYTINAYCIAMVVMIASCILVALFAAMHQGAEHAQSSSAAMGDTGTQM